MPLMNVWRSWQPLAELTARAVWMMPPSSIE